MPILHYLIIGPLVLGTTSLLNLRGAPERVATELGGGDARVISIAAMARRVVSASRDNNNAALISYEIVRDLYMSTAKRRICFHEGWRW